MKRSQPIITLKNVAITYKSGLPIFRKRTVTHAIKDVSFEIYHGETVGIIGRNGSGKSTLLQLLNGIIQPDYGSIDFHKATSTLLSLTLGYDQNVSGRNNAILQGMLLGLSKSEIIRHMDDIIEFSELQDFIDAPVKNYSTGMKQRLGFAVAMKVKTDILLIDEILAVGDQIFRKKSRLAMEEKINSGDTVILVSHNEADIKQLCNRVIWLVDGAVEMSGTPDEVLPEYRQSVNNTK